MTVKLVVLYTQPDDKAAFDQHYLDEHMPLAGSIPGLERAEAASFVAAADGGEQTYHRIASLYFADMDSLQTALATDQGKATGKDYAAIAPPGSRMFIAELD